MTGDDDFLVTVRRHPQDWQTAEYRMTKLSRLRWDSVSGGVGRATPYPMIFATVWCDQMESGELAHSCMHGPPPHEIKVCLIKKYNKKKWKRILEMVSPRP